MIDTLILASHNQNKHSEFVNLLKPLKIKVLSLHDLKIPEIEETGRTFFENALLKAKYVASLTKYPVLSDDSGIIIDGLYGHPGVYSARFMIGHTYQVKMLKILELMQNKPHRTAIFHATLILYFPNGTYQPFLGDAFGEITETLQGLSGFGYDPIFYSPLLKKTFAEATSEEKNLVSHRAIASRKLVEYLKNIP